jgi:steroid delta-isomerase-like uncharacterized protein
MGTNIKQLLADLIEAWNDHDPIRAAQFYAEDYHGTDVGISQPQVGRAARIHVLESYIRVFPDIHYAAETVVEGDQAVLIWTMTGTQNGPVYGLPATGRRIEIKGVSVLRFADGLITHGTNIWDTAGFLRALKLLPEL